jgi:hypothetical protein
MTLAKFPSHTDVADPPMARPLERLEADIVTLSTQLAAATCQLLVLIGEFDAAEGWRGWGMSPTAHWLSWQCGVGLNAAREQAGAGEGGAGDAGVPGDHGRVQRWPTVLLEATGDHPDRDRGERRAADRLGATGDRGSAGTDRCRPASGGPRDRYPGGEGCTGAVLAMGRRRVAGCLVPASPGGRCPVPAGSCGHGRPVAGSRRCGRHRREQRGPGLPGV